MPIYRTKLFMLKALILGTLIGIHLLRKSRHLDSIPVR
jgi:hypothetical protein